MHVRSKPALIKQNIERALLSYGKENYSCESYRTKNSYSNLKITEHQKINILC